MRLFRDTKETVTIPHAETGTALEPFAVPLWLDSPIACSTPQPVIVGIPCRRGVLLDHEPLALLDDQCRESPIQFLPLARWPDGSIKWLLLSTLVDSVPAGQARGLLHRADRQRGNDNQTPVQVKVSAQQFSIDTDRAVFQVHRHGSLPLESVQVAGKELLASGSTRVMLVDGTGGQHHTLIESSSVEASGPVQATICVAGRFTGSTGCRFVLRLCFFAGTALMRARLTLHNPRRARHRHGLWDLGDPGSVLFREFGLRLGLKVEAGHCVRWKAEENQPSHEDEAVGFSMRQHASGGENWQSRNHVNRDGENLRGPRGYRVQSATRQPLEGLRAAPLLDIHDQAGRSIAIAVPEFWQQFPKSVEMGADGVFIGFFPAQTNQLHELQGGEQKTHECWFNFAGAAESLAWVHNPARLILERATIADSGAVPWITRQESPFEHRLDALLSETLTGPKSFFARRETIDEFGWRNFGDVYADHEGQYFQGSPPVVSHYNNQYDTICGFELQLFRTRDRRWFELLDALARHVIDVDIYHTQEDKAAYNGGLFWHTDHYRDAATATHRAFSRASAMPGRPYGGGPCNEHNYTTGLLHYYFLTGDPLAREAVVSLAQWVLVMDDGGQHPLGVFDEGPTGFATCTGEPGYHGPGRGAGNSINALLDAFELTGERLYIEQAEVFIQRCIHPQDDVAARDLLNVELRWSYTVFLMVLIRYLDLKSMRGETDNTFAYARSALLRYAAWMLENERPYFDQRAKLEFPTETWAAQELRKANVMRLASGHAPEPLSSQLWNRGQALADRAWADLQEFETRASTRSLAICMREGLCDAWLRATGLPPPSAVQASGVDFGRPVGFVPQKTRVRNQLKTLGGVCRVLLKLVQPWNVVRLWALVRQ